MPKVANETPAETLAKKLHHAYSLACDELIAEQLVGKKNERATPWDELKEIRKRGYQLMAQHLLLNVPDELMEARKLVRPVMMIGRRT